MSDLEQIRAEIARLEPSDRLRLAADLMDRGRGDLAHAIAEPVVMELGAALVLARRLRGPGARP